MPQAFSTATLGLRVDVSRFNSDMSQAARYANNALDSMRLGATAFEEKWSDMTRGIKDTKRIVSGILISQGFYTLMDLLSTGATSALTFASNMEQASVSLEYFVEGSDKAAKSLAFLREMNEFAARTPFSTEAALEMSKYAQSVGIGMQYTKSFLQVVTDAAAATGATEENLQRVIFALGQMKTKGRVASEEIRQLANANIPVYDILQEELGLTGAQISNIGKYWISADRAIVAILSGLEKRYAGAADRIADTMSGMLDTISDDALIIAQQAGHGIFDTFEGILTTVRDKLDEYRDVVTEFGSTGLFNEILLDIDPSGQFGTQVLYLIGNVRELGGALLDLYHTGQPLINLFGRSLYSSVSLVTVGLTSAAKTVDGFVQELNRLGITSGTTAEVLSKLFIAYQAAQWGVTLGQSFMYAGQAMVSAAQAMWNFVPATLAAQTGAVRLIGTLMTLAAVAAMVWGILGNLGSFGGLEGGEILPDDYTRAYDDYLAKMAEYNEAIKKYQESFNEPYTGMDDSVGNAIDNLDDLTKKSGSAAKQVEKDWVAAFDEVYRVPMPDDYGGGGGAGAGKMPELPDLGELLRDFTVKFPSFGELEMPEFPWDEVLSGGLFDDTAINKDWFKSFLPGLITSAILGAAAALGKKKKAVNDIDPGTKLPTKVSDLDTTKAAKEILENTKQIEQRVKELLSNNEIIKQTLESGKPSDAFPTGRPTPELEGQINRQKLLVKNLEQLEESLNSNLAVLGKASVQLEGLAEARNTLAQAQLKLSQQQLGALRLQLADGNLNVGQIKNINDQIAALEKTIAKQRADAFNTYTVKQLADELQLMSDRIVAQFDTLGKSVLPYINGNADKFITATQVRALLDDVSDFKYVMRLMQSTVDGAALLQDTQASRLLAILNGYKEPLKDFKKLLGSVDGRLESVAGIVQLRQDTPSANPSLSAATKEELDALYEPLRDVYKEVSFLSEKVAEISDASWDSLKVREQIRSFNQAAAESAERTERQLRELKEAAAKQQKIAENASKAGRVDAGLPHISDALDSVGRDINGMLESVNNRLAANQERLNAAQERLNDLLINERNDFATEGSKFLEDLKKKFPDDIGAAARERDLLQQHNANEIKNAINEVQEAGGKISSAVMQEIEELKITNRFLDDINTTTLDVRAAATQLVDKAIDGLLPASRWGYSDAAAAKAANELPPYLRDFIEAAGTERGSLSSRRLGTASMGIGSFEGSIPSIIAESLKGTHESLKELTRRSAGFGTTLTAALGSQLEPVMRLMAAQQWSAMGGSLSGPTFQALNNMTVQLDSTLSYLGKMYGNELKIIDGVTFEAYKRAGKFTAEQTARLLPAEMVKNMRLDTYYQLLAASAATGMNGIQGTGMSVLNRDFELTGDIAKRWRELMHTTDSVPAQPFSNKTLSKWAGLSGLTEPMEIVDDYIRKVIYPLMNIDMSIADRVVDPSRMLAGLGNAEKQIKEASDAFNRMIQRVNLKAFSGAMESFFVEFSATDLAAVDPKRLSQSVMSLQQLVGQIEDSSNLSDFLQSYIRFNDGMGALANKIVSIDMTTPLRQYTRLSDNQNKWLRQLTKTNASFDKALPGKLKAAVDKTINEYAYNVISATGDELKALQDSTVSQLKKLVADARAFDGSSSWSGTVFAGATSTTEDMFKFADALEQLADSVGDINRLAITARTIKDTADRLNGQVKAGLPLTSKMANDFRSLGTNLSAFYRMIGAEVNEYTSETIRQLERYNQLASRHIGEAANTVVGLFEMPFEFLDATDTASFIARRLADGVKEGTLKLANLSIEQFLDGVDKVVAQSKFASDTALPSGSLTPSGTVHTGVGIDTETTGLFQATLSGELKPMLMQLSAVAYETGEVKTWLVNYGHEQNALNLAQIQAIEGVGDAWSLTTVAQLDSGKTLTEIRNELLEFLRRNPGPIGGYNAVNVLDFGGGFDYRIIKEALGIDLAQLSNGMATDTLEQVRSLFEKVYGTRSAANLGTVYQWATGTGVDNAHEATSDIISTRAIEEAIKSGRLEQVIASVMEQGTVRGMRQAIAQASFELGVDIPQLPSFKTAAPALSAGTGPVTNTFYDSVFSWMDSATADILTELKRIGVVDANTDWLEGDFARRLLAAASTGNEDLDSWLKTLGFAGAPQSQAAYDNILKVISSLDSYEEDMFEQFLKQFSDFAPKVEKAASASAVFEEAMESGVKGAKSYWDDVWTGTKQIFSEMRKGTNLRDLFKGKTSATVLESELIDGPGSVYKAWEKLFNANIDFSPIRDNYKAAQAQIKMGADPNTEWIKKATAEYEKAAKSYGEISSEFYKKIVSSASKGLKEYEGADGIFSALQNMNKNAQYLGFMMGDKGQMSLISDALLDTGDSLYKSIFATVSQISGISGLSADTLRSAFEELGAVSRGAKSFDSLSELAKDLASVVDRINGVDAGAKLSQQAQKLYDAFEQVGNNMVLIRASENVAEGAENIAYAGRVAQKAIDTAADTVSNSFKNIAGKLVDGIAGFGIIDVAVAGLEATFQHVQDLGQGQGMQSYLSYKPETSELTNRLSQNGFDIGAAIGDEVYHGAMQIFGESLVTGAASSFAFTAASAAAGAKLGAAGGSLAGPLGTALGAGIGIVAGTVVGGVTDAVMEAFGGKTMTTLYLDDYIKALSDGSLLTPEILEKAKEANGGKELTAAEIAVLEKTSRQLANLQTMAQATGEGFERNSVNSALYGSSDRAKTGMNETSIALRLAMLTGNLDKYKDLLSTDIGAQPRTQGESNDNNYLYIKDGASAGQVANILTDLNKLLGVNVTTKEMTARNGEKYLALFDATNNTLLRTSSDNLDVFGEALNLMYEQGNTTSVFAQEISQAIQGNSELSRLVIEQYGESRVLAYDQFDDILSFFNRQMGTEYTKEYVDSMPDLGAQMLEQAIQIYDASIAIWNAEAEARAQYDSANRSLVGGDTSTVLWGADLSGVTTETIEALKAFGITLEEGSVSIESTLTGAFEQSFVTFSTDLDTLKEHIRGWTVDASELKSLDLSNVSISAHDAEILAQAGIQINGDGSVTFMKPMTEGKTGTERTNFTLSLDSFSAKNLTDLQTNGITVDVNAGKVNIDASMVQQAMDGAMFKLPTNFGSYASDQVKEALENIGDIMDSGYFMLTDKSILAGDQTIEGYLEGLLGNENINEKVSTALGNIDDLMHQEGATVAENLAEWASAIVLDSPIPVDQMTDELQAAFAELGIHFQEYGGEYKMIIDQLGQHLYDGVTVLDKEEWESVDADVRAALEELGVTVTEVGNQVMIDLNGAFDNGINDVVALFIDQPEVWDKLPESVKAYMEAVCGESETGLLTLKQVASGILTQVGDDWVLKWDAIKEDTLNQQIELNDGTTTNLADLKQKVDDGILKVSQVIEGSDIPELTENQIAVPFKNLPPEIQEALQSQEGLKGKLEDSQIILENATTTAFAGMLTALNSAAGEAVGTAGSMASEIAAAVTSALQEINRLEQIQSGVGKSGGFFGIGGTNNSIGNTTTKGGVTYYPEYNNKGNVVKYWYYDENGAKRSLTTSQYNKKALGGLTSGLTLTGELGRELAIFPDGTVRILGENGAELGDLPSGTRILNNKDTEDILKYTGPITSLNKYAKGNTTIKAPKSGNREVDYSAPTLNSKNWKTFASDVIGFAETLVEDSAAAWEDATAENTFDSPILNDSDWNYFAKEVENRVHNTFVDGDETWEDAVKANHFIAPVIDEGSWLSFHNTVQVKVESIFVDGKLLWESLVEQNHLVAYQLKITDWERFYDEVATNVSNTALNGKTVWDAFIDANHLRAYLLDEADWQRFNTSVTESVTNIVTTGKTTWDTHIDSNPLKAYKLDAQDWQRLQDNAVTEIKKVIQKMQETLDAANLTATLDVTGTVNFGAGGGAAGDGGSAGGGMTGSSILGQVFSQYNGSTSGILNSTYLGSGSTGSNKLSSTVTNTVNKGGYGLYSNYDTSYYASEGTDLISRFLVGGNAHMSSGYGPRTPPCPGASSFHQGQDIGADGGTPIKAGVTGIVQFLPNNGGAGNNVRVVMEDGSYVSLMHMSGFNSAYKNGDLVYPGDIVGYVGTTGVSTGNHLHVSYYDANGQSHDPVTALAGISMSPPKSMPAMSNSRNTTTTIRPTANSINNTSYAKAKEFAQRTGFSSVKDSLMPSALKSTAGIKYGTPEYNALTQKQKAQRNARGFTGHADGGIAAGLSLTGEEGRELAIFPDGTIRMLGEHGAELGDLPAGTRILNNRDTEDILKYTGPISKLNKYASGSTSIKITGSSNTGTFGAPQLGISSWDDLVKAIESNVDSAYAAGQDTWDKAVKDKTFDAPKTNAVSYAGYSDDVQLKLYGAFEDGENLWNAYLERDHLGAYQLSLIDWNRFYEEVVSRINTTSNNGLTNWDALVDANHLKAFILNAAEWQQFDSDVISNMLTTGTAGKDTWDTFIDGNPFKAFLLDEKDWQMLQQNATSEIDAVIATMQAALNAAKLTATLDVTGTINFAAGGGDDSGHNITGTAPSYSGTGSMLNSMYMGSNASGTGTLASSVTEAVNKGGYGNYGVGYDGNYYESSGTDIISRFLIGGNPHLSSGYGPRTPPCPGASSYHQGQDIGADGGTPIKAGVTGIVKFLPNNGGAGNNVRVYMADGSYVSLMHMSGFNSFYKDGDLVYPGDVVGYVGTTGTSTGNHLHVSYYDANGQSHDPVAALANMSVDPPKSPPAMTSSRNSSGVPYGQRKTTSGRTTPATMEEVKSLTQRTGFSSVKDSLMPDFSKATTQKNLPAMSSSRNSAAIPKDQRKKTTTVSKHAAGGIASGLSLMAEEGRELAILPDGTIELLTDSHLYDAPPGTQILSNRDTEEILKYAGGLSGLHGSVEKLADGNTTVTYEDTDVTAAVEPPYITAIQTHTEAMEVAIRGAVAAITENQGNYSGDLFRNVEHIIEIIDDKLSNLDSLDQLSRSIGDLSSTLASPLAAIPSALESSTQTIIDAVLKALTPETAAAEGTEANTSSLEKFVEQVVSIARERWNIASKAKDEEGKAAAHALAEAARALLGYSGGPQGDQNIPLSEDDAASLFAGQNTLLSQLYTLSQTQASNSAMADAVYYAQSLTLLGSSFELLNAALKQYHTETLDTINTAATTVSEAVSAIKTIQFTVDDGSTTVEATGEVKGSASGSLVTKDALYRAGELGLNEAIIPLEKPSVLSQVGAAIGAYVDAPIAEIDTDLTAPIGQTDLAAVIDFDTEVICVAIRGAVAAITENQSNYANDLFNKVENIIDVVDDNLSKLEVLDELVDAIRDLQGQLNSSFNTLSKQLSDLPDFLDDAAQKVITAIFDGMKTEVADSKENRTALEEFVNQIIAVARERWAAADAANDEAAKAAAHQLAESARALLGYSGGPDGSQKIQLSDETASALFASQNSLFAQLLAISQLQASASAAADSDYYSKSQLLFSTELAALTATLGSQHSETVSAIDAAAITVGNAVGSYVNWSQNTISSLQADIRNLQAAAAAKSTGSVKGSASGSLITKDALYRAGELGLNEAIIPLEKPSVLSQVGAAIGSYVPAPISVADVSVDAMPEYDLATQVSTDSDIIAAIQINAETIAVAIRGAVAAITENQANYTNDLFNKVEHITEVVDDNLKKLEVLDDLIDAVRDLSSQLGITYDKVVALIESLPDKMDKAAQDIITAIMGGLQEEVGAVKDNKTALEDFVNQVIALARERWATADAAGDDAGKAAAHQLAESARALLGYSGGPDGSQNIALSGETASELFASQNSLFSQLFTLSQQQAANANAADADFYSKILASTASEFNLLSAQLKSDHNETIAVINSAAVTVSNAVGSYVSWSQNTIASQQQQINSLQSALAAAKSAAASGSVKGSASGSLVTKDALYRAGELGLNEAIIPLERSDVMSQVGSTIASYMPTPIAVGDLSTGVTDDSIIGAIQLNAETVAVAIRGAVAALTENQGNYTNDLFNKVEHVTEVVDERLRALEALDHIRDGLSDLRSSVGSIGNVAGAIGKLDTTVSSTLEDIKTAVDEAIAASTGEEVGAITQLGMTLEQYVNMVIAQARIDYNNATTDEERAAAHQKAEDARALLGYSGGPDGSQNIPLDKGAVADASEQIVAIMKDLGTNNDATLKQILAELLKALTSNANQEQMDTTAQTTTLNSKGSDIQAAVNSGSMTVANAVGSYVSWSQNTIASQQQQINSLQSALAAAQAAARAAAASSGSSVKGSASGSLVTKDALYRAGEFGLNEAIIPLERPDIMKQVGSTIAAFMPDQQKNALGAVVGMQNGGVTVQQPVVTNPAADMMYMADALAQRVLEVVLPQMANMGYDDDTAEAKRPIYVGNLIADESGLKALERKLYDIRQTESSRRL